jgi:SpoVK/Ycf46/Vps4 family AAA+-type ATPase
MSTSRHILALVKSHVEGNEQQFLSVAMQVAAKEAQQGHGRIAKELKDLVDRAKETRGALTRSGQSLPISQPRGDLAALLSVEYPETRLTDLVVDLNLDARLGRILLEQRQQERLRNHGLRPRRKILVVGPPGSGKTMTAAALAGELHLPLFTILMEGLITRFMGETASKLRTIFDAMVQTRGVYFFDEFDAIGARRDVDNDVGEIRRVLNSFLTMLEQNDSQGLIVAATNHPELLDRALFRRFDDVLEYSLPTEDLARKIVENRLASFDTSRVVWGRVIESAKGLSQADLTRAADEAAKAAVLSGHKRVATAALAQALKERHTSRR